MSQHEGPQGGKPLGGVGGEGGRGRQGAGEAGGGREGGRGGGAGEAVEGVTHSHAAKPGMTSCIAHNCV